MTQEPKPKNYDTTQARRQTRRNERLNQIARETGYTSWSALATAAINGEHIEINKMCSKI